MANTISYQYQNNAGVNSLAKAAGELGIKIPMKTPIQPVEEEVSHVEEMPSYRESTGLPENYKELIFEAFRNNTPLSELSFCFWMQKTDIIQLFTAYAESYRKHIFTARGMTEDEKRREYRQHYYSSTGVIRVLREQGYIYSAGLHSLIHKARTTKRKQDPQPVQNTGKKTVFKRIQVDDKITGVAKQVAKLLQVAKSADIKVEIKLNA